MPEESVFNDRTLDDIYNEIQSVYLADNRGWIVGFSGGKDSTTIVQLIFEAIQRIPKEKQKKEIHILSVDTLIDPPVIIDQLNETLKLISESAKNKGLPIKAHNVTPEKIDSFFVNMIGRGYPAPTNGFRWCTERLKIRPANKFILETVSKYGEAILVLGVRSSESSSRNQRLKKHKIDHNLLSRHTTLPGAYVYSPIVDFSTSDVWQYLLDTPNPWGGDNHQLLALYRSGSKDGECPLVVDKSSPSCGNSRFGCWLCTVVTKDKTMENLIDNGEEWLLPLLEYRNWIFETTLIENKPQYRQVKRRDGSVQLKKESDKIIYGPYKFEWRKEFLKQLFLTEKKASQLKGGTPFHSITLEELIAIRNLWKMEENDCEDSVRKIYEEIRGEEFPVPDDDNYLFTYSDIQLLNGIAEAHQVAPDLIFRMINVEKEFDTMSRRVGIRSKLKDILRENWKEDGDAVQTIIDNRNTKEELRKKIFENDN